MPRLCCQPCLYIALYNVACSADIPERTEHSCDILTPQHYCSRYLAGSKERQAPRIRVPEAAATFLTYTLHCCDMYIFRLCIPVTAIQQAKLLRLPPKKEPACLGLWSACLRAEVTRNRISLKYHPISLFTWLSRGTGGWAWWKVKRWYESELKIERSESRLQSLVKW